MQYPFISRNDIARPGKTHWRREAVLDVYNCILASFLFVSPWLFDTQASMPGLISG